jgi:hypothetical protein
MTPMDGAARRRLLLGTGAVLSLNEAAALLPFSDAEARRWLRSRGLVRDLEGRSVVRWLDVVFHPELGGPLDAPLDAPPRARLARVPLPLPKKNDRSG